MINGGVSGEGLVLDEEDEVHEGSELVFPAVANALDVLT